jgi:hypothetical protein
MAKEPRYRPGEIAPASGQYPIVGPRGGDTGVERTITRGEPFPPTPERGQGYGRPDLTVHKAPQK